MELISKSQDSLLIINFWATWCKPCVKELPCFYEVEQRLSSKGVRVLLVSLDFKRQLETVLKPFMIKRGKGPEAWLLDEPDYDLWINKIDRSWSGAIPATLFIRNSEELQMFHEGEFTCESLNDTIQKILNK
jgi:thiol-disulfide isomerase/thioredoxin